MNRITPCNASGTNVITLTPLDAAPLIEKYADYEVFSFVAANTSTGRRDHDGCPSGRRAGDAEGVQDERVARRPVRAISSPARFIWRSTMMRWTPAQGAL
jgi:hypothetical protein